MSKSTQPSFRTRHGLFTREALGGHLARGAVRACVGDLARPPGEIRLQCHTAREAPAGESVALDIAHVALLL